MSPNWKENLLFSAKVTFAVYLSSLVMAAVILFVFPPGGAIVDAEWKLYFHIILVLAGLTVVLARWWCIQLLSKSSLNIRYRVNGMDGVLSGLKLAALTSAILADLCILMGIGFYLFTRNPNHLLAMVGFWGVHLALGMASLSQGKSEILKFASVPDPLKKVA